jgi:hypothetical protein
MAALRGFDSDPEKKRYFLEMMSIGLLDKDGARELKQLLQKDVMKTNDLARKNRLLQIVVKLDDYLSDKINLMMEPYVKPTNVS